MLANIFLTTTLLDWDRLVAVCESCVYIYEAVCIDFLVFVAYLAQSLLFQTAKGEEIARLSGS